MTTSDRTRSSPASTSPSRRAFTRPAGLIAAASITLLFGGIVGWYLWNGAPQERDPLDDATPPSIDDIPNAADLPKQPSKSQLDTLGNNSGPFMQFADREDPTRVAGEITADKAQPLEGRRYRLDRPRAWNFLRDGRMVYIEADAGRAAFAEEGAKGRPEEATLEGNVVLKLFAKRPDGSRPNPASDTAIYSATMQELRFDSALGRVTIPGKALIAGSTASFQGSGITVLFSEISERVELLRVDHTDYIEFRPGVARVTHAAPATPLPSNPSVLATLFAIAQTSTAAPNEVEYKLTASSEVRIQQAQSSITGEKLEGWLRMVDNQLPDRTRSMLEPAKPQRKAQPPAPAPGSAATPAAVPAPAEPQPTPTPATKPALPIPAPTDEPVRITFAGPLEVSPLKATSTELRNNDAFLRITSSTPGGVLATDQTSGALAAGTLLEYGATRRDVAIGSADPFGASLTMPGSGVLIAQRVELSMLSGSARVRGAGLLAQQDPLLTTPDLPDRALRWSQSGEFDFVMRDGQLTQQLSRALLVGDVRASDPSGEFSAQQLQAEFAPIGTNSTRIARALLAGNAHAKGKDGSFLDADAIDVKFSQGKSPTDVAPRRIVASGHVSGERAGDSIKTDSLAADLGQDASGATVATFIESRGGLVFRNADGIEAVANTMSADPIAKIVDLSGPDTTITRGESIIAGSHIRLFSDERRMDVLTPGSFTHREPGKDGKPDTHAKVSWWRSMSFNDSLGRVECIGKAHAEILTGEIAKDTVDAERVVVHITDVEVPATDSKPASTSRTVSRVDADGDAASNRPVKIEVRRYADNAAPGTERRLEQLLYLEGQRVVADIAASTLSVPVAGKLLTVDRRDETPVPSDKPFSGDARGDALFRWNGSLLMDQKQGQVRMLDSVRLDHRRVTDGSRVELECNALTATILADRPTETTTTSGQLKRAVAEGRVWMRAQGRELTAGEVAYDATGSTVTAAGESGQPVTLMDIKTRSPFAAKWLSWNIATDRFEALQTQPIIVPH